MFLDKTPQILVKRQRQRKKPSCKRCSFISNTYSEALLFSIRHFPTVCPQVWLQKNVIDLQAKHCCPLLVRFFRGICETFSFCHSFKYFIPPYDVILLVIQITSSFCLSNFLKHILYYSFTQKTASTRVFQLLLRTSCPTP